MKTSMQRTHLGFGLVVMLVLLLNSGCKVLVEPVDPNAPTAYSFSADTYEDQSFTDYLDGQPTLGGDLVYEIVDHPFRGTIAGFNSENGYFTYRPNANFSGSDYFTYRVWEDGLYSEIAVVTITVRPSNDAPTAASFILHATEDEPLSGILVGHDSDGDRLSYRVTDRPFKGTLTYDSSSGAYTYRPFADAYGSDSFRYEVSDGLATSRSALVSIQLDSMNDIPYANPESFSVTSGTCVSGTFTSSDVDSQYRSYFLVTRPTKGAISLDSVTGAYTYCANSTASGYDTFSFRAYDGTDYSSPATVTASIRYQDLLRAVTTNFAPTRKKPIAPKP